MKTNHLFSVFLFSGCIISIAYSQQIKIDQTIKGKNIPQINYVFNRISGNINSFYEKLTNLKKHDTGVVRIVHIGDSYIQAGFLTGTIRTDLQEIFGNGGRGLVFPYQVAETNAPDDVKSSSNIHWQISKLSHFKKNNEPGISGYYIETNYPSSVINIGLQQSEKGFQSFDKLKFFTEDIQNFSWIMHDVTNDTDYIINRNDNALYNELQLKKPSSHFSIRFISPSQKKILYGVSLEKNQAGIIYHSIGVNGARYDQYNSDSLFWKQLPALQADIFIVSLGTNEAKANSFNEIFFLNSVSVFISKLLKASPNATVLLTTPADSYKGKNSNAVLRQLNVVLNNYCFKNNIGMWDLYKTTNGYGSAKNWYRMNLLSKDFVHFTSAGYQLQAKLFFIALMKGYNDYNSNN